MRAVSAKWELPLLVLVVVAAVVAAPMLVLRLLGMSVLLVLVGLAEPPRMAQAVVLVGQQLQLRQAMAGRDRMGLAVVVVPRKPVVQLISVLAELAGMGLSGVTMLPVQPTGMVRVVAVGAGET